ncbi:MAG: ABC transporter substrate-binding protein [Clostridiaceae bacterium]|nr:ABC transporter substrate-binding protein [Clostridiaceae bacterium]
MKKILSALLVCIVITLLLCSCSQNSDEKDNSNSSDIGSAEIETGVDVKTDKQTNTNTDTGINTGIDTKDSADNPTSAASPKIEKDVVLPELQNINFVLDWTPNTNHTGIYVASELGYFAEEGLTVDIQSPPEDGAEALVAAGRADIGVSFQDYLAPAFAMENPLPLTAIATLINHNTSGIVSLKDKEITSPAKLEGHTYATWNLPIEQAILKQVMADDQGDWSKVELFPSTVTDIQASLQTQVDAVWIYYGWDGVALEQTDLETNYWYFKDINPVFDYYSPLLFANNNFLGKNPNAVRAFLHAVNKGYQYAIDNPEKAADILLQAAPGLDREIVVASQKWLANEYISDAPYWGYIDAERWNGFYAWLWEKELIEHEISAGMGFTNEYLPGK